MRFEVVRVVITELYFTLLLISNVNLRNSVSLDK